MDGPAGEDSLLIGRVAELVDRGLQRYCAGDLDGAISDWEHALVLDPGCERAHEYADYVRSHFSALVTTFEAAGSPAEAAAEFDAPFGLQGLIPKPDFDHEPYEEMAVEAVAEVDMGVPAGYEDLVGEPEQPPAIEFVADEADDITEPYGGAFSEEATRNIRPPPKQPRDEELPDFDEVETQTRVPEIDDGWDLASTAMFDGPEEATTADAGEMALTPAASDGDETRDRDSSDSKIELSPELEAVASRIDPRDEDDDGLADALDAVTAGLMSIDVELPEPPDDPIRLSLPQDAGLDLGDAFDRDMGDVIDQPESEPEPEPSVTEDDDPEPVSITIEAEEPDDVELEPAAGESPGPAPVPLGEGDDDDLAPEITIEAAEQSSGNLNIELGHLEQIDESLRDEESGIRPGQRVVLGSGDQPKAVDISFRTPGVEDEPTIQHVQPHVQPPGSRRAPTEDPTISEASIELDDSLLSFDPPTREHAGVQDVIDDQFDGASRETSELPDSASRETLDFDRATSLAPHSMSYEDVVADLLDHLDAEKPDTEAPDERTRRRVIGLIERAELEMRNSQFSRAVIAADLALQEGPESAVAQKIIHRHRDLLLDVYRNYLGVLTSVPALAVPMHELQMHAIDHRAAFLLSRIDGALSFEDILDVSGMSQLEAFRHLSKLLLQGVLEVR